MVFHSALPGLRELDKDEMHIVPAQRCPAQRIGRGPHDRCLDQRRIGQDDRQRQQCQGEGEGRPAPGTERYQSRRARSAADRRIAAPPEQQSLALQQQDGQRRATASPRRRRGAAPADAGTSAQILVVMTWKPAGIARIAGTPNCVSVWTKAISPPASSAGNTIGSVTRRSVCQRAAAKDRRGVLEIGRNVVERVGDQHEDIRKAVAGHREDDAVCGVDVDDMLVFAEPEAASRANRLRMPLFGAARISQAIAPRKGGVTNEAVTRARMSRRSGRSVRATSQASGSGRRRRRQRHAGGDFERRQIWSREARIGGQAHEIGRRSARRHCR